MRFASFLASLVFVAAAPSSAQDGGGQPFRVFFDWGKPELTRDAEGILNDAAAAYRAHQPNRVEVAGHTDLSGSASFNMAASRRRAEVVKAYLVSQGIRASAIAVSAYGESQPIVSTEDGVREVQNRRVEVRFEGGSPRAADSVPLVRGDGSPAGSVRQSGGTLTIEANGLTPGAHGLHLHAVGRCDGPGFASAGAHWNPTNRQHGSENPDGPHLGDLPNLVVGADGRGSVTLNVPEGFVDADGSALVIHAAPDDNRTDPSGNSGDRIACAAFTR